MGVIISMLGLDLEEEIKSLPKRDPSKCEQLIRQIHDEISRSSDYNDDEKDDFIRELKAVASRGLKEDLTKLLEKKGLQDHALDLVLNHLTSLPELAKYLNEDSKDKSRELKDIKVIKRRLGPHLEVLGALKAKNINVTQDWVKKLCEKAPCFLSLPRLSLPDLKECCQGATAGEVAEVHRLLETVESCSKQLSAVRYDEPLTQENEGIKANHKKDLDKAERLLEEANNLKRPADRQAFKEKLEEVAKVLKLTPEVINAGKKKPSQAELLPKLKEIINQGKNFVNSVETYSSDLEVVAKVSGGRALCGIYHSKYMAPTTAPRPILLLPTEVETFNPAKTQESNKMRFSEKSAAAKFITQVESSSTNIGFGVAGVSGLVTAEVMGKMVSEQGFETSRSSKASASNETVLRYEWIGKKTFRIERGQMIMPMTVRKMARAIIDENSDVHKRQEAARTFLERYGSHLPTGLHTLGGVFFTITEATSKSSVEHTTMEERDTSQLEIQNSVGYGGSLADIRANVRVTDNSSGGGFESENRKEKDRVTTFVRSMGPEATDLTTFKQKLSYNSTWALIDRGPPAGYIAVWELLKSRSDEFNEVACLLEGAWREDECKREAKFQNRLKDESTRKELSRIKAVHLKKPPEIPRYSFANCKAVRSQETMIPVLAYDKAIEFIMENPQHRFCEMQYAKNKLFAAKSKACKLTCWEVVDGTSGSIVHNKEHGKHVLFYSKHLIIWKNLVPV